ncbi:MAG: hypothetical protein VXZ63_02545, partial [Planctomycetota bacterium]|nr:hypothetical protein [Planctomycetota bacterium]
HGRRRSLQPRGGGSKEIPVIPNASPELRDPQSSTSASFPSPRPCRTENRQRPPVQKGNPTASLRRLK